MRRDDRPQAAMARERRQERIDQPARHHEQVPQAVLHQAL